MASRMRVALGMSGGVDSAAAAAVLMRAGHEVVGVTCRFQDGEAQRANEADAAAVCARLGIAHAVHCCEEAFECQVVRPFVQAYADGLTPSPCAACNARVKLPELARAADELGCSAIATGHYARIARLAAAAGAGAGRFVVKSALDVRKDQSYMLALVGQDLLARLLLPLGALTKTDVRLMADDLGLPVADKPESQDICFAPEGYRTLLAERGVAGAPGRIVDVRGTQLGRHTGLENYTVGQRRGIGIAAPEPLYVTAKRPAENELVVGTAEEALVSYAVVVGPMWQAFSQLDEPLEVMVKLRYRSTAQPCIIKPMQEGRVLVELLRPQPTTSPGQVAVFSLGETVLGGGTIEEVGRR